MIVPLLGLILGLALSQPAAAAPLAKRLVLGNGLAVLHAERPDPPLVTVSVAVRAGTLAEPPDKPGVASLTAALLKEGTKGRSSAEISGELDFVGATLSVSGGDDFVFLQLRVLKKDLSLGLEILSDVVRNPRFDEGDIKRKVEQLLAQIRQAKEDPEHTAKEAFAKEVFGEHPYGRTDEELAASLPLLSAEDLRRFHEERYSPQGAVVALVGAVTEGEARELLGRYFGDWSSRPQKAPPPAKQPPPGTKKTLRIDKKISQANIALGHLGVRREDPDYYPLSVANFILGGGSTSRLTVRVREERGLAYDVHSVLEARKERGAFFIWVQTKNASAAEALREIFAELDRLRKEGPSEEELAEAKAYLTGSFPMRLDTSAKIASLLTSIELYNLGLDYPDRYHELINAVTREDIRRVITKHLRPDQMTVVVVADQDKTGGLP